MAEGQALICALGQALISALGPGSEPREGLQPCQGRAGYQEKAFHPDGGRALTRAVVTASRQKEFQERWDSSVVHAVTLLSSCVGPGPEGGRSAHGTAPSGGANPALRCPRMRTVV